MKVGVVVKEHEFRVETRPEISEVPEGWVLIDILAVGLCGTDYHILEGLHPFLEYPRVIGHELSGRVAQAAPGWSVGDDVVINPYVSCGKCRPCQRGKPNCCMDIQVLGVHRDGGMADQLLVPSDNLYSAAGLPPLSAALVEFLAIGAHAVRRSDGGKGDRVLVTGVGPIGIGTALFARLLGMEVHLLDLSETRLKMAQDRFGFLQTHRSIAEAIAATDGDGFDISFDATGHPKAIEAGFETVAHGGSYVLVSVVKNDITFSDPAFHKREMRLIGSRNALKEDFDWVISSLQSGDIVAENLQSAVLTLDALETRFADLAADRADVIKVIVRMQNPDE